MIRSFFIFLICSFCFTCSILASTSNLQQEKKLSDLNILGQYNNPEEFKKKFLQIAKDHGVDEEYPQDVLDEVKKFKDTGVSFNGLLDLRHIPFVTIDNDHSKDLDQAIFITSNKYNSHFKVYYAIADASYFVSPGSAIEQEAERRIFTTYLPSFDIPVLPRYISEDVCSLNEGKERRAVVAIVDVDDNGNILSREFQHAVILSRAKLSFRGVQEFLDDPSAHAYLTTEYAKSLENLQTLGEILIKNSAKRGVIPFRDRELKFIITPSYVSAGIYCRFKVELYNEQISVMVNHIVGELIQSHGKHSIHRFHPKISDNAKKYLKIKLRKIGRPWKKKQSLTEFVQKLSQNDYKDLAAETLVARNSLLAKYALTENGHNGLKLEHYDHFTAPMRRYSDIITHRILLAIIKNEDVPYQGITTEPSSLSYSYLENLVDKINHAATREREIESRINDFIISLFMKSVSGENLEGVILAIDRNKVCIKLLDYPFEIWMSLEKLRQQTGKPSLQLGKDKISYHDGKRDIFKLGEIYSFLIDLENEDQLNWRLVPIWNHN